MRNEPAEVRVKRRVPAKTRRESIHAQGQRCSQQLDQCAQIDVSRRRDDGSDFRKRSGPWRRRNLASAGRTVSWSRPQQPAPANWDPERNRVARPAGSQLPRPAKLSSLPGTRRPGGESPRHLATILDREAFFCDPSSRSVWRNSRNASRQRPRLLRARVGSNCRRRSPRRRSARNSPGGSTSCARAQANFCSRMKQQQRLQHCSALQQPQ